jgi:DNA gyrase subunit B/topoisomerase-4 subunit B
MAKSYTASDITVLEGLDPVRKRPGMYIGGVGLGGLHHLVWEILDNAVDEAMNGYATEIEVVLHENGSSVTVKDDGRGIPIDLHKKSKKSALEVILTTLHAGGKFDEGAYKTAGGLHGVGSSVVNALSKSMVATVKRDGFRWQMSFERGQATSKLQKLGPARGSGTEIRFDPDPVIFPKIKFEAETIAERCEVASFLHRNLKVTFIDEGKKTTATFLHPRGIDDYLERLLKSAATPPVHDVPFSLQKDEDRLKLECVLQWTEATEERVKSYVNGIPTAGGGTHENGLRAGINRAVRSYIETHKLLPKGLNLLAEDLREGMVGLLSVFIPDPQFQGQTKDKLNNPDLQARIEAALKPAMEKWLHENRSIAEAIVARMVLSARAREASRAASAEVIRKTATKGRASLPGKLYDCSQAEMEDSELFLVEGDSAGGTAKLGRDRNFQAILPLRGKVLNTESMSTPKALENKELQDLVVALGCGIGKSFDLGKLRYQRVILLADADSDGHHITTLLLTFFFRHLRALITDGRLFIAVPPLYRIDIGKTTHWAEDEEDKERILAEADRRSHPQITRFKGLGEMPASTLWETTLNPATRRLLRVDSADALAADKTFQDLMGKDPATRYEFIMARSEEAEALDL